MNLILKGDISLTDNIQAVREILYSNNPQVKIVTLEEDGMLPLNHPNVLSGACLLPPIDALIAEADGDENLFDSIYFEHFNQPFQFQFIAALMTALYLGTNLILFIPELDTNVPMKLKQHFYLRYGIDLGIVGLKPCQYDPKCIPMWLQFIYVVNGISARELLYYYPVNAVIPPNMMDKLLVELKPYGKSLQDKENYILYLCSRYKEKPNLKTVLHGF